MKTKSRWMQTTVMAVVLTLMTALVEPAAFGKDPEDSAQSKDAAVEKTAPVTLPDRPVFKVAQVTAPAQTPSSPVRSVLPSPAKPKQSTSKSKKWIFIVAAAGAAGATAFLVSRGSNSIVEPPTVGPTIVIGTPIVSQP